VGRGRGRGWRRTATTGCRVRRPGRPTGGCCRSSSGAFLIKLLPRALTRTGWSPPSAVPSPSIDPSASASPSSASPTPSGPQPSPGSQAPFSATPTSGGWRPSPGGLVTALRPVVATRHGVWVGWAGDTGTAPQPFTMNGMRLYPVGLSADEVGQYYDGQGTVALWDRRTRLTWAWARGQMARASSLNAVATRRAGGASRLSS
jgi:hypothetical protein